ncbi:MAG TPA: hypothetical protein VL595_16585 [Pseudonocardia sp.]|jgi:hypothetical protein|nr:hypothetical protein [Pseudonocardia sp.]
MVMTGSWTGSLSPRLHRTFALIGPALVVIFFAGFLLSGFFPPSDPSATARGIADMYRADTTAIRVGCVLMCVGLALFAPYGCLIAMCTKQIEKRFPLLTYVQLVALAACTTVVVLIPLTWALAAYRPDDVSPDVTRMLHDAGWFLFLFSWPPFSIWIGAVGVAVLRDGQAAPLLPRWSGYLSLWTALLFAPAALMAFFKTGPMSYNGVIAFYIPTFIFFVWVAGMTVALLRIAPDHATTGNAPRAVPTPSAP